MQRRITWLSISILLVVALVVSFSLFGCKTTTTAETTATATTAAATTAAATTVAAETTAAKTIKIIYLTPSTDSGYWGVQVVVGIENAIADIKKQYNVAITL